MKSHCSKVGVQIVIVEVSWKVLYTLYLLICPGVHPVQVGSWPADIGVSAPAAAHRGANLPPRHGHRPPKQEAIHSKVWKRRSYDWLDFET